MEDIEGEYERAASAFPVFSPLVRKLPPPDTRFIVPNGRSALAIFFGLATARIFVPSTATIRPPRVLLTTVTFEEDGDQTKVRLTRISHEASEAEIPAAG